jgi:hypothetical protein
MTKGASQRSSGLVRRPRAVAATLLLGMFLFSTVFGTLLFGGLAASSSTERALPPGPVQSATDGFDALSLAEQSLERGTNPSAPLATYTPTTRADAVMTYDAKDGYIVLFGGVNKSGGLLSDTSTFVGGTWTKVTTSPHPAARFNFAMSYDYKDRYVVLFGGAEKSGVTNDTWKFVAGKWSKLTTAQSPPARYDATMTYDSADGYLVLFGGYGYAGVLNDTWTFVGGVWTNITTSHHPAAAFGAMMKYDPTDGYVVLFGGRGASGAFDYLSTTWKFVGGTWTKLAPSSHPSGRFFAAMAYDSKDGYIVLFGGFKVSGVLGDTWTFSGGTWKKLTPSPSPSGRDSAAMAYDPIDGYTVLFGGYGSSSTPLSGTWTFVGGSWAKLP